MHGGDEARHSQNSAFGRQTSTSIDRQESTVCEKETTRLAIWKMITIMKARETAIHEPGVDKLHEGFTYEKLLNMQRRDEADQHQAEATGERTRFSHSIDRALRPSID
ncbi:hypothetical protein Bca52824_057991 [Brassica carinata]|uniref:Uncharacterized protein n=1 Tax=Brassica carinata TaxID=52824 RepID=A0A8X7UGR0_BRACI|nr:hypothetical protein Bca52824_057991 [Brassica carinata]